MNVWHIVFQHGEEMMTAYHVVNEEVEEDLCELCMHSHTATICNRE